MTCFISLMSRANFHLDKHISVVLGGGSGEKTRKGQNPGKGQVPTLHTSAVLAGPLVFSSVETIYLWKIQTRHVCFTLLLCVEHTVRLLPHT